MCTAQVQGQAGQVSAALAQLRHDSSSFRVAGAPGSGLAITAVLDPLSRTAQHLSNVLDWLRATLQPDMKVWALQPYILSLLVCRDLDTGHPFSSLMRLECVLRCSPT